MATSRFIDIALKLRGAREFSADANRVERSIKGVDGTTTRAGTSVGKLNSKTGKLGRAMRALGPLAVAAGGALAAFGAIELKKSVDTTRDFIDQTVKLNDVMGGSTQETSRLIAVAQSRGVSTDNLITGNVRLSKAMDAARKGTGDADKAFKSLGVSQAALKSDNVSRVFNEAVDGFAAMDSGAERNRASLALFGKSWVKLRPILKLGANGLKEQKLLAGSLGAELKDIDIDNGKKVKGALREGQMALFGLRVTLGKEILPLLAKAAIKLSKFIQDWGKGAGTAGQLKRAFKDIGPAVIGAIIGLGKLVKFVMKLYKGSGFVRAAFRVMFKNNIIVGIIELFKVLKGAVQAVGRAAGSVGRAFKRVGGTIKDALRDAINFIIRGWNSLNFKVPSVEAFGKKIGGFTIGVGRIPELAEGGNIMRSGLAMVGERGPELLSLPRGAQVQPLGAGAGFGGTVVTKVYLDRRQIAEAVGSEVSSRAARR